MSDWTTDAADAIDNTIGLVRERIPFMGEGDPLPADLEPVRDLVVSGAFVA